LTRLAQKYYRNNHNRLERGIPNMPGTYWQQGDRWIVGWWDKESKKQHKITRYEGLPMYHEAYAIQILSELRAEWKMSLKGLCQFRIEKWTGKGFTDVIEYYEQWLKEVIEPKRKPGTVKAYQSYLDNWIAPFFRKYAIMLHETQLDTLNKLLNTILKGLKEKAEKKRKLGWLKYQKEVNIGATAQKIMMALHSMMDYAWRSRRIPELPPFPKHEDYNIVAPKIDWIDTETFWKVIEAIDPDDRPIILWMYYHLMREAEACALQWSDWDEVNRIFIVRRSISAREVVESTKTGEIYPTPCHSDFYPYMRKLSKSSNRNDSPFIFINNRARNSEKRYTNESIVNICNKACKKVGVNIRPYAIVRHSRASQMINELRMSIHEVKEAGTWKRLDSVTKYAKTDLTRKRELIERGSTKNLPKLKIVGEIE
ncbi:MAG: tyrosine-type recombinase/integrase, partial [Desulfobacterales bacterium]